MASNEIRAGGAFVEINAKLAGLESGLRTAFRKVGAFGDKLQSVGTRIAAVGTAALAPLALSMKRFAQYGNEMANLQAMTGLSLDALAGLKVAADAAGIPLGSIIQAVRQMQVALAKPSKGQAEALKELGLDAQSLLALRPEQQMAALAEAFQKITDPAQKAALASRLLGRAGVQLLPIIADGAATMNAATQQARQFGLVLDKQTLGGALATDEAFNRLSNAVAGLQFAIGQAMTPFLPLIDAFSNLVGQAAAWIRANPEVIASFAKIALGLTALGGAFVALGLAIKLALSGALLTAGAFIVLGSAVLAVTDSLGVTALGFGELFNSIRIGGTGLGTWMAAFWTWVHSGWTHLVTGLSVLWDGFWTGLKGLARNALSLYLFLPQKILEAWEFLFQQLAGIVNDLIESWNSVADTVGAGTIEFKITGKGVTGELADLVGRARESLASAQIEDQAAQAARQDRRLAENASTQRELQARMKGLFLSDPQDASGGLRFDTSRAKAALEKIGNNLWEGLTGTLLGAVGNLDLPELGLGGKGPFQEPDLGAFAQASTNKPNLSAVGTFSAAAAESVAATGMVQRQLEEARKSNDLLKGIFENTRDLDLGLA